MLITVGGAQPALAQQDQLQGAWVLEKYSFEGEQMQGAVDPAQAGIFLFVDGHYSFSYVLGDQPRQRLPADPSPVEIASAYRSFVANTGTYVATDSTLQTFPVVTRNPNVQADNADPVFYQYKVDEETMVLVLPEAPGDVKVKVTYVLRKSQDGE